MQRSLNKALKYDIYKNKRRLTAFLPSSISNLWAWYDVATISTLFTDSAGTTPVTNNADPIGYIADRSGNGRYVRQTGAVTTRPTYSTNIQNGLPAASFDGGDYLDSLATIDSFPLTLMAVIRTSATVGSTRGVISSLHSTTFGTRLYFNTSNAPITVITSPQTLRTAVATFAANTSGVLGSRLNTTESAIVTNGTISSGSHTATVANQIVALGRFNVNQTSSLWNGYICEVCIYNRALSDVEIGQLSTYLNTKWMVY